MNIQLLIVIVIVALAASFVASSMWAKRKAFSPKTGCGTDCGCGNSGK
jgi:hypothetical protein